MMVAAIKGNVRDASDGKPKCIENHCMFVNESEEQFNMFLKVKSKIWIFNHLF